MGYLIEIVSFAVMCASVLAAGLSYGRSVKAKRAVEEFRSTAYGAHPEYKLPLFLGGGRDD